MDRRNLGAIIFCGMVLGVLAACLFSPLAEWLSVERLSESHARLAVLVKARPLIWTAGFFLLCVAATAICFPAAPILGLTGGALFGFWTGLAVVLVASAIGSTLAFFNARFLLRDCIQHHFRRRVEAIDRGIAAHGAFYLLVLRINPVVPYWLVNLGMGLTAMRPRTYILLTPLGLLPATLVYVTAGAQLPAI